MILDGDVVDVVLVQSVGGGAGGDFVDVGESVYLSILYNSSSFGLETSMGFCFSFGVGFTLSSFSCLISFDVLVDFVLDGSWEGVRSDAFWDSSIDGRVACVFDDCWDCDMVVAFVMEVPGVVGDL